VCVFVCVGVCVCVSCVLLFVQMRVLHGCRGTCVFECMRACTYARPLCTTVFGHMSGFMRVQHA